MNTPKPYGYVIIDHDGRMDWDGDVHDTVDAAIESLTGPSQMYVHNDAHMPDETPWWADYAIHPVGDPINPASTLPPAPNADDRLRERVENMAEDYRHSDTPYIPASEVFHRLRSILKERETK